MGEVAWLGLSQLSIILLSGFRWLGDRSESMPTSVVNQLDENLPWSLFGICVSQWSSTELHPLEGLWCEVVLPVLVSTAMTLSNFCPLSGGPMESWVVGASGEWWWCASIWSLGWGVELLELELSILRLVDISVSISISMLNSLSCVCGIGVMVREGLEDGGVGLGCSE